MPFLSAVSCISVLIGPDRNAEGMAIGFGCVVCVSVCVSKFFWNFFFGGKFKYMIRKNSEFLAGNLNANGKMQNI